MSLIDERVARAEEDIQIIKRKGDKVTVTHISENQRYRIVIERAASTKGVTGVKIEANGDSIGEVAKDTETLYDKAIAIADKNQPPSVLT